MSSTFHGGAFTALLAVRCMHVQVRCRDLAAVEPHERVAIARGIAPTREQYL